MNISDAIRKLDNAINYLNSGEVARDAMIAAADTSALVANRVIQKGIDEKGQPFTPYSTKVVPAWFYSGKSRNAAAEGKISKNIKEKRPISYKEFRAINNLKTDKKNFEFTGLMWRGFGVKSVSQSGNIIEIVLGGKTTESQKRFAWNSEQEGKNIALPSVAEITLIKNTIVTRITQKLK